MQNAIPMSDLSVKKILLATDFSAASNVAFHESIHLCGQFGASLYILNVFEYASGSPPESGGLLIDLDSFYKDAELSIDVLIDTARRNGVSCEGAIASGLAHAVILDTSASQSCDLIVLGTRAIRGFERLVFGSTAEAVLRNSNRPVFTVGPRAARHKAKFPSSSGIAVFATDFHVATTKTIVYAALFARTLDLPLHCLHVLPRVFEGNAPKPQLALVITEALHHLIAAVDPELPSPVCAVTYGSEISNAVVDYALNHEARLIVLGVRRASLVASHVPAHIAYRIITEATCPVLTMAFPIESATIKVPISKEIHPEDAPCLRSLVRPCPSTAKYRRTFQQTTTAYNEKEPTPCRLQICQTLLSLT